MITLRDHLNPANEYPVLGATPELRTERYGFLGETPTVQPRYLDSPLLLPPAPCFPGPALNRIVWPVTGMSHYALGHLLVSAEVAATVPIWVDVVLDDGLGDPTTLTMYTLQRQPLADGRPTPEVDPAATAPPPATAWVLTVVCQRYFDASDNSLSPFSGAGSWGTVLRGYGSGLFFGSFPQTVSDLDALIPSSNWGAAVNTYWDIGNGARAYLEPQRVLMDSMLGQVGLRAVATDGTALAGAFQDPVLAATALTVWLARYRDRVRSGGLVNMDWPTPWVNLINVATLATLNPGASGRARIPGSAHEGATWLCDTSSAFGTAWFDRYVDWQAKPHFQGDMIGFPAPPPSGLVSHVVYEIDEGITRVRRHPDRWPIGIRERTPRPVFSLAWNAASKLLTVTINGLTKTITLS